MEKYKEGRSVGLEWPKNNHPELSKLYDPVTLPKSNRRIKSTHRKCKECDTGFFIDFDEPTLQAIADSTIGTCPNCGEDVNPPGRVWLRKGWSKTKIADHVGFNPKEKHFVPDRFLPNSLKGRKDIW